MTRPALLAVTLPLILGGCSLPSIGGSSDAPRQQSAPVASSPAARQCLAQLGAAGAQFTPLPDRYISTGCTNINTVQLRAVAGDRSSLAVTNLGPVTCPVSTAFSGWARFGVDRAARQIFGSPLASIDTMGSYVCRNVAGSGRKSAHATADAIDISGFRLADGRRISVKSGWNGSAQERQFLRAVQASACRRFGTVLGPEYNSAHHDHFHLEGVIEGSSFCR